MVGEVYIITCLEQRRAPDEGGAEGRKTLRVKSLEQDGPCRREEAILLLLATALASPGEVGEQQCEESRDGT